MAASVRAPWSADASQTRDAGGAIVGAEPEAHSLLDTVRGRLAGVPDFASACRALVDSVWSAVRADVVAYVSIDPTRRLCHLEAAAPEDPDDAPPVALDAPPFPDVLAASEPVVLRDPPVMPWVARRADMPLVCTPLRVRDEPIGVLLVRGPGDAGRIEQLRRLLVAVAPAAAAALHGARRAAHEDVLAVLRHDVARPVHAALGWLDMLVDRLHDGERDDLARLASTVATSLHAVVDTVGDCLELATIEHGVPWLHRTDVDLLAVVRDVLTPLEEAATAKQLGVAVHGTHLHVRGDRRQLARAVRHLLLNAIQYTPARGRVDVRVAADGDTAVLVIADTGPGLDAASVARLFTKHARFHPHLGIPGAGVGLYLTKAIVEAHGGRISASSSPGRGAAFTVRLPRGAAPPAPA